MSIQRKTLKSIYAYLSRKLPEVNESMNNKMLIQGTLSRFLKDIDSLSSGPCIYTSNYF